ncbi:Eco57I restriction-modification methylase domain-containing protein [Campylobacter helveticus]|uniref:Eco57I restriction-modification methylase domain-containing protein n=1 Tax=Campylobacter helveticus TaxID=28898 RepID=UPI0011124A44|nr:SNF2-related protein [Campylobacter helveticus]TNB61619.1 hypothetical protein FDW43_08110 [Campylobacter helveticus]
MQSLLILSNGEKLSHIATITELNEALLKILENKALDIKNNTQANNQTNPLKAHILSLILTNDYHTDIGEHPEFDSLIQSTKPPLIFITNELNRISFCIKDKNNDDFITYDYEDFIKEYGFNDFKNLLEFIKEQNSITTKDKETPLNDKINLKTQGESNVTSLNEDRAYQFPRSKEDRGNERISIRPNDTSEEFTYIPNPISTSKSNSNETRQDEKHSALQSSTNEPKTNAEFLQTNHSQEQDVDTRFRNQAGQSKLSNGLSHQLSSISTREARENDRTRQEGKGANIRDTQDLKQEDRFGEFSHRTSLQSKTHFKRYSTQRLRTRFDAFLQSSLTKVLVERDIRKSLELFRNNFKTSNAKSNSHAIKQSLRNDRRGQRSEDADFRTRASRNAGGERGRRDIAGEARGINGGNEFQVGELERFNRKLGRGNDKSPRSNDNESNGGVEGIFGVGSKEEFQSNETPTQTQQSSQKLAGLQSPISKEFSTSSNEPYQTFNERAEFDREDKEREFSKFNDEANSIAIQSSLRTEESGTRKEDEQLLSSNDDGVSTSLTSKENTPNQNLSQSKTELRELSKPSLNANERREFANSNNESLQGSFLEEKITDKIEIITPKDEGLDKNSLTSFAKAFKNELARVFGEDDERLEQESVSNEASSQEQSKEHNVNDDTFITTENETKELAQQSETEPKNDELIVEFEETSFKTFEKYQLLKKLEAEDYKGQIDFNLGKKERIKANYEALSLTQTILNDNRFIATKKEQETLAKFSGYGGLKDLFYDEKYKEDKEALLKLVGSTYFKELRSSCSTAFYTPSFIIKAMYERLFKLGVSKNEKIKVLEPSCGTGRFMSLAPANFEFEAVEKDTLSAMIAKFLHPSVVIHNKGLEEVSFKKEFDLVVGNPPYANESVWDVSSAGYNQSLHNYFAIKSAELLKENGLLSFVISSHFLDNKEDKHRQILSSMGTLVDSYRLSSEAFKHTEVISDLIFYAKRDFKDNELNYKAQRIKENFTQAPKPYDYTVQDSPHYSRVYFEQGVQNVLGSLELGTNQHGVCLSVKNKEIEQDLKEAILESAEINAFKNNAPYEDKSLSLVDYDALSKDEIKAFYKIKNGNTFFMQNKLYIKQEDCYCYEAFFEDSLPLEKKYLIEPSLILSEEKKNFTYKSYLNEEELKIANLLCKLRDRLKEHLEAEKELDDSKESNEILSNQKQELLNLRNEILKLAKIKSFNATSKKSRDKEGKVFKHSFKDILFLDKLSSYELLALEIKENKNYEPASLFYQRINKPLVRTLANNEEEALMKTLSETGKIDLNTLQSYLPSKDLEQILYTLLEKRLIFHSLEKQGLKIEFEKTYQGKYELAETFLSGNVKQKYKTIETMIQNNQSFTGLSLPLNEVLNELEKVFPAYVNYEDIHINFGSNFIALEIYENFIEENFFDKDAYVRFALIDGAYYIKDFLAQNEDLNDKGEIVVDFKEAQLSDLSEIASNFTIYDEFNEIYFTPKEFLQRVLNNKSLEVFHHEDDPNGTLDSNGKIRKIKVSESIPTKIALEKKEELLNLFESYLLNHKIHRDKIEKDYNEKINVYNLNKNSYAKFFNSPTLSTNKSLREHQKSVAFKGILQNTLLLDHQVGAGKTLAGTCIVMEQLRMNLVKKALILVPNHLTNQWEAELKEAYPNAKILVGDKINDKKARKEFLHRIKYGDYEAVIMKHSTFENLNVLQSYERGVYYDYIDDLRDSLRKLHEENIKGQDLSAKELKKLNKKLEEAIERKINKLEKKLERKAKGKKYDDELAFEDLGFDLVMVDEAHHFKNLLISTNQDGIKGLSTTDSAKAMKMYCVSKFLHENNHKLYFLTGTPVSNSIAEFFVMQKYLQPEVLESLGLSHFDNWQKTFTEIVESEELDSSGINYKIVSRLSKFVNAPELMATYMQNADVVSIEDVEKYTGKLTPNLKDGKVINVIAPRSEDIASYIGIENEKGEYNKGSIIYRMDNLREDVRNNNMLKCTSDARKAALDFRLINNLAQDYEDSKVNKMCELVLHHYKDTNYKNNTQLIFCDMGVSKLHSSKIDLNKEEKSSFKSLEQLKEELNLILEYDEDKEENYYAQYQYEDEDGNKLKKPKLIKRYDIEELLELSGNSFDVYADILKKLVRLGIKQEEIAFIGDASTDKQKQDLFDKVNAGTIRVLIGSTAKMGAGTNVQKKVVALHELDCPWRPCDLEQRQGRVIRQGNEFFEKDKNFCVAHYRYATEQTYDSRMFQINEQKLKPLAQFKKCDFSKGIREFDSIDSEIASVAEMKAYATGNPFILEKHKITTMLKSEQRYYESYKKSILSNERAKEELIKRKEYLVREQEALREMVHNKDFEKENYIIEAFDMKINKKAEAKKDKNEALKKAHQIQKEQINTKIKEIFLKPESEKEFTILKANGVSLVLKGYFGLDNKFIYEGELRFDTGQSLKPSNLIFKATQSFVFHSFPEIDGLLERIKNNFKKANENLNKTSTFLKNTEAELKIKEEYLSKNTINHYPRKSLLETLKKDEKNINEIFAIRNKLRKEGIKIDMQSNEINHLLPQYPKLLNEKGKFDANLVNNEIKENEPYTDKSTEQKADELKEHIFSLENVEIKFKEFNKEDSLNTKVKTLLANQDNITKANRAKDILR